MMALMVYAAVVGGFVAAGGLALERLSVAAGKPRRVVWLAALTLAVAIPLAGGLQQPRASVDAVGAAATENRATGTLVEDRRSLVPALRLPASRGSGRGGGVGGGGEQGDRDARRRQAEPRPCPAPAGKPGIGTGGGDRVGHGIPDGARDPRHRDGPRGTCPPPLAARTNSRHTCACVPRLRPRAGRCREATGRRPLLGAAPGARRQVGDPSPRTGARAGAGPLGAALRRAGTGPVPLESGDLVDVPAASRRRGIGL